MATTTQNTEFKITIGGNPSGTFLHGYLTARYIDLKEILGKPHASDGYKVDAEWDLLINGKQITIYNYKDGKNYNGTSGIATTKITEWHIGSSTDVTEECTYLASKVNGKFVATT